MYFFMRRNIQIFKLFINTINDGIFFRHRYILETWTTILTFLWTIIEFTISSFHPGGVEEYENVGFGVWSICNLLVTKCNYQRNIVLWFKSKRVQRSTGFLFFICLDKTYKFPRLL